MTPVPPSHPSAQARQQKTPVAAAAEPHAQQRLSGDGGPLPHPPRSPTAAFCASAPPTTHPNVFHLVSTTQQPWKNKPLAFSREKLPLPNPPLEDSVSLRAAREKRERRLLRKNKLAEKKTRKSTSSMTPVVQDMNGSEKFAPLISSTVVTPVKVKSVGRLHGGATNASGDPFTKLSGSFNAEAPSHEGIPKGSAPSLTETAATAKKARTALVMKNLHSTRPYSAIIEAASKKSKKKKTTTSKDRDLQGSDTKKIQPEAFASAPTVAAYERTAKSSSKPLPNTLTDPLVKAIAARTQKNETSQTYREPADISSKWPPSSANSLPPLLPNSLEDIVQGRTEFLINEECTSLKLSPSGRHVIAGFTDGTLRLFDLTGNLRSCRRGKSIFSDDESSSSEDDDKSRRGGKKVRRIQRDGKPNSEKLANDMHGLFDCDSSAHSASDEERSKAKKRIMSQSRPRSGKANKMVDSKCHQYYGAVACQIHARGVHTSLLMDVDCSEDGLYAFGGVLRGSMELVAVDLSDVERYHDGKYATRNSGTKDILDLIEVHRYSDAKLRGFSACTRLRNGSNRLEYLLFTGKGIKNIHIWSFTPPQAGLFDDEPLWQCLYDTQTNGNTISMLAFRHDPNGCLQGISKSDDQKLRVWDLSYEQQRDDAQGSGKILRKSIIKHLARKAQKLRAANDEKGRPKRPPFVDVNSTANTLGVYGSFAFAGGADMYNNQMSIVSLDVEDIMSPYNHTELALPSSSGGGTEGTGCDTGVSLGGRSRASRSGRQQRGDLKSVVNVAGLVDAGHVLLELSDGSVVHYSQSSIQKGNPQLQVLPPSIYMTSRELALHSVPSPHQFQQNTAGNIATTGGRKFCLSRIGCEGMAVVTSSSYNPNTGRGTIVVRHLPDTAEKSNSSPPTGYWGFHGVSAPICIPALLEKPAIIEACKKPKQKSSVPHSINIVAHAMNVDPPSILSCPSPSDNLQIPSSLTTSEPKTNKVGQQDNDSGVPLTPAIKSTSETASVSPQSSSKMTHTIVSTPETDKKEKPDNRELQNVPVSPPSRLSLSSDEGIIVKNNDYDSTELEYLGIAVSPEHKGSILVQAKATECNDEGICDRNDVQSGAIRKYLVTASAANAPAIDTKMVGTKATNRPRKVEARKDSQPNPTSEVMKSSPVRPVLAADSAKQKLPQLPSTSRKDRTPPTSTATPSAKVDLQNERVQSTTRSCTRSKSKVKTGEMNSSIREIATALCQIQKTPILTKKKGTQTLRSRSHNPVCMASPKVNASSPPAKEVKNFLSTHHRRKRPRLLLDEIPKSTVSSRIKLIQPVEGSPALISVAHEPKEAVDSQIGCATLEVKKNPLEEKHEGERRKLAMHHRAAHEMLRKKILASAHHVVKIWTCKNASGETGKSSSLDAAKGWLNEAISNYQMMLSDMIQRQRMETSALASRQTVEKKGYSPILQVSFPFPEVFSQANDIFDSYAWDMHK